MKILILSERFFPEEFLVNDLTAELHKRGNSVEVLTQVPSYPYDKIFDGYRNRLFQTTREYHDIPVHRVRTVLGYNSGGMKRKIVNYISFAFLTSLWSLFFGWKYDRVFVCHTGPLSMASAALVLRFVWWRKCIIWTQDIWPDTVYNYGVKPTRAMRLFLNTVVRVIYWAFSAITVSCPGFIDILGRYTRKKIEFVPQWTTDTLPLPPHEPGEKLVFTFAGNIGSVQNLDRLIEAFSKVPRDKAELRIVGSGIYLERLKALAGELHLDNVVFTGRRPRAEMPKLFECSDVLVISLKPEFSLTIPAKFQAYIASGRPIFGCVRGDCAKLIEEHELWLAADPGDIDEIVAGFTDFCNGDRGRLAVWRQNALAFSEQCFCREKIIDRISDLLIG